jgi:hypothetical protein
LTLSWVNSLSSVVSIGFASLLMFMLLYPDYDVVCRYAECCSRAVGYVEGTGTGRVGTLRN